MIQGIYSKEVMQQYLLLTDIRSDAVKDGIIYHAVNGYTIELAASMVDMKPANLHRAIQSVDRVIEIVDRIKTLDSFVRPIPPDEPYAGTDKVPQPDV